MLCSAVLLWLWAPVSTQGQTIEEQEENFRCGDCAECTVGIETVPVPIDNLITPKPPDLVLCANNNDIAADCMAYWANYTPQTISGVQDAVVAINAKFLALGRKVNVLIDGHGSVGVQCFGRTVVAAGAADCGTHPTCDGACPGRETCLKTDTTGNGVSDACKCGVVECIGNATLDLRNKKKEFIDGIGAKPGAKNKIKDLVLLGCSAAATTGGQDFLAKLGDELGADSVKGFSGINSLAVSVSYRVGNDCGTFPVCGGGCPGGQICKAFSSDNSCSCVESCGPAPVCNGACTVAGETCRGKDTDGDDVDDQCAEI